MRGLFVTGTDTGVGKTVVAGAVLATLRSRGVRVAAYKPVVTGLDDPPAAGWPHDHELLAAAADMPADDVAPLRFGPPASPHLAAELAGMELSLADLVVGAHAVAARADAIVVEGVGGLLVPLTAHHSVRDFARELDLDVVVAARPGLGTINHTLLTLEAARRADLRVRAVVLTPWPEDPTPVARSNRETIARVGEVDVLALPPAADGSPAALLAAGARLPVEEWLEGRAPRRPCAPQP
jgi:dethiobiotin synthetase